MKVSKEHYLALREKIAAMADKIPAYRETIEKEYAEKLAKDGKARDAAMRVRWDAFWAAGLYKEESWRKADYLDSHTDTALRAIFKELAI